ncbi:MAG: hypothetical protein EHM24_14340 [Acidobacteria bacterium]|nr:MAG: hypothetical protein EHM24_14340 [Acidobacteriota bacterium]
MRLSLHVAAKDLRAHSLLVGAWCAALVTDLVLSTGWAHMFVVTWPMAYDLKRLAVSLLAALLGAFVAVAAIHTDPSVSTTAFWLTRPIGRGTLLAAKLLVVALAAVVPALEQLVAAAMVGAVATDAWRILVEALFFQALIVLPLAAIAAITADAGRYALSVVAALAALPVVQTIVSYTVAGRIFPGRPVTGLFTAAGLVATTSLVVLGHQLLTRKTRRSAALAVVSAILVLVAFNSFTPAGRQLRLPAREDRGSVLPTDTRPEIQARVGAGGLSRVPAGVDRARVLVDFEVTGLPSDTVAYPLAVRASWSFPGGPSVESKEIGFASSWWTEAVTSQPLFEDAIGRLLGTSMLGSRPKSLAAGAGFELAPLDENRGRSATLALDVELLLVRLREAGRLPLQPGREIWAGAHHLVALRARSDWPGVRIGHLRPSLILRGGMWHDAASGLALVVLHKSLGEAAVAFGGLEEFSFGGGLSHVRHRTLSLGYPAQVNAEWLSGAEVVAVTVEPEETIRRVVRIEGVRFENVRQLDGRGL